MSKSCYRQTAQCMSSVVIFTWTLHLLQYRMQSALSSSHRIPCRASNLFNDFHIGCRKRRFTYVQRLQTHIILCRAPLILDPSVACIQAHNVYRGYLFLRHYLARCVRLDGGMSNSHHSYTTHSSA